MLRGYRTRAMNVTVAGGAWAGGQRTSNMHAYATSYGDTTGTLAVG